MAAAFAQLLSECYRNAEEFEAVLQTALRAPCCLLLDMRMTA
jgi:FixJ family two-component response regulator